MNFLWRNKDTSLDELFIPEALFCFGLDSIGKHISFIINLIIILKLKFLFDLLLPLFPYET